MMYRWKAHTPEESKIIIIETKIRNAENKHKKGVTIFPAKRKLNKVIEAVIVRAGSRDDKRSKTISHVVDAQVSAQILD